MEEIKAEKTTIEPFHDVCIGQELKPGEIVSGGIIVPETQQNYVNVLVLAAGTGAYDPFGKFVENPAKVGDVIFFLISNAFQFWDANRKHWAVRANAVVGRIRRDAA